MDERANRARPALKVRSDLGLRAAAIEPQNDRAPLTERETEQQIGQVVRRVDTTAIGLWLGEQRRAFPAPSSVTTAIDHNLVQVRAGLLDRRPTPKHRCERFSHDVMRQGKITEQQIRTPNLTVMLAAVELGERLGWRHNHRCHFGAFHISPTA